MGQVGLALAPDIFLGFHKISSGICQGVLLEDTYLHITRGHLGSHITYAFTISRGYIVQGCLGLSSLFTFVGPVGVTFSHIFYI